MTPDTHPAACDCTMCRLSQWELEAEEHLSTILMERWLLGTACLLVVALALWAITR